MPPQSFQVKFELFCSIVHQLAITILDMGTFEKVIVYCCITVKNAVIIVIVPSSVSHLTLVSHPFSVSALFYKKTLFYCSLNS